MYSVACEIFHGMLLQHQLPALILYMNIFIVVIYFILCFFRARRMEIQACTAAEKQDEHEYSPSGKADRSEKEGD